MCVPLVVDVLCHLSPDNTYQTLLSTYLTLTLCTSPCGMKLLFVGKSITGNRGKGPTVIPDRHTGTHHTPSHLTHAANHKREPHTPCGDTILCDVLQMDRVARDKTT